MNNKLILSSGGVNEYHPCQQSTKSVYIIINSALKQTDLLAFFVERRLLLVLTLVAVTQWQRKPPPPVRLSISWSSSWLVLSVWSATLNLGLYLASTPSATTVLTASLWTFRETSAWSPVPSAARPPSYLTKESLASSQPSSSIASWSSISC